MKAGHISKGQLIILIWFVLGSRVFLNASRVLAEKALISSWLTVPVGFALSLVPAWALYRLLKRFGNRNIVDVARDVFGNSIGRIIGLLLVVYFLTLTPVRLREFGETISAVTLPRTPISIIIGLYTVMMVYAALNGIEGLGRTARLLLPVVLFPALLILVAALPWTSALRLLPLMDVRPIQFARTSLFATTFFAEIIILGVVSPYIRKGDDLKGGLFGAALAAITMTLVTAETIMVFGEGTAMELQFPTFTLSTIVHVGTVLERVEAIMAFVWLFTSAVSLSALFLGICLSLAHTLALREYKPLVWSLGLITYALAFLPGNIMTAFRLETEGLLYYMSMGMLALPLFLYLAAVVARKGGAGGVTGDANEGGSDE